MSTTWGPTQIANTNDDANDDNRDGGVLINGLDSDGWQFGYSSNYKDVGLRWPNVTVPQGATIESAVINVYRTYYSGTLPAPGSIYCNDVDSADDFSTTNNLSSRTKTTASVEWNAASGADGWVNSPDLSSIVQEVVDRPGWASGNAIMFIWWSTSAAVNGYVQHQDYGRNATYAAKLTITYSAAGGTTYIPHMMAHYARLHGD